MTRRRGLGKGLEALIPGGEIAGVGGDVLRVPVDRIRANPRQPRSKLDPASLAELADSIREHGVLQPVVLTREEAGEGYVLIAGERRLEAAKMAGLAAVPALIRQVNEQTRLELALVENLQRTDLNPLEAAEGYRQLSEDFELSHEEIASRVGKSRTAITNTLRLLKLGAQVRKALTEGAISEGHARALLTLPSAQAQNAVLQTVIQRGLNVRQTEELVRKLSGKRRKAAPSRQRSPEEVELEDQLRQSLGTRVSLKRTGRGGRLVIHFYSDEELQALIERILASGEGS